MIRDINFLAPAAPVVLHHHERWDGGGYPQGLAGEAIPEGARIVAVADALDAMTTERPYSPARTLDEAYAEILRGSGKQFDPRGGSRLPGDVARRRIPGYLPEVVAPGSCPKGSI
jgi:HD-GYP domain-containing protein (c-di-GMP phosphodiesterase class II)